MFQKGRLLRLSSKDSLMYNHRERSFYQNKRRNLSQRVGEMLTLFSYSTTHHSDLRTCSIKRIETHTTAAWHSICSAHHDEQADTEVEIGYCLREGKASFNDRQAFGRNVGKSHTEAINKVSSIPIALISFQRYSNQIRFNAFSDHFDHSDARRGLSGFTLTIAKPAKVNLGSL